MKPTTPPVKFLLVDDREENLIALDALLRREGVELLKARSGDQALELLLENDVALALLDVQMPEMDGFALAELMRGSERTRHVPIIFVTAGAQDSLRVFQGYDAGAVDFLFKPIEPRILKHKVSVFHDLYKQRQELEETLRLNEMFVAAVGHDLKDPLNAMLVGADVVARAPLDAGTKRAAERIRTSGKRMLGMIDDLFDLARARLGSGIPIERQRVDLLKVVQSVVSECLSSAPGRPIELRQHGSAEGEWDPGRLAQIVSNVVGNAVRHGSPSVPIELGIEGNDRAVTLSVQNGGAMPPETLASLFSPFRSPAERQSKQGLGLGLYIVQQLVQAHGGTIDVTSNEASGTRVKIKLPRAAG